MMFAKEREHPMYRVEMRIVSPAEVRAQGNLIVRQVESLLNLGRTFGRCEVYTDEPCRYRGTELGLQSLAEALAAQCIGHLVIFADEVFHAGMTFQSIISFGSSGGSVQSPTGHTVIIECTNTEVFRHMAHELRRFVETWFVALGSFSAFVDTRYIPDIPTTAFPIHQYRSQHNSYGEPLWIWEAVIRLVDGVHWGQAISADLYRPLGDQEHLLRAAPVVVAKPLGGAVWLQTSENPPATDGNLAALRNFLGPLVDWTDEDVLRLDKRARFRVLTAEEAHAAHAEIRNEAEREPLATEQEIRNSIPIIQLGNAMETALNVHVASPPTDDEIDLINDLINRWWKHSFTDEYLFPDANGAGILWLEGPHTHGTVMRWRIDWGQNVDGMIATTALHKALQTIARPIIERIVIGIETLG